MVAPWVQDIIEKCRDKTYPIPKIGKTYVVMEDDEFTDEPGIVRHIPSRGNSPTSNVPMKKGDIIKVTDGQYMGTYGISNFWYWRRLTKKGKWTQRQFCGYSGPWTPCKDPTRASRR
jgi:hypothetical protein